MKEKIDLLQGALDLLMLKALALEPLHGLGVKTGQRQLETETENWQRISLAIATTLKAT